MVTESSRLWVYQTRTELLIRRIIRVDRGRYRDAMDHFNAANALMEAELHNGKSGAVAKEMLNRDVALSTETRAQAEIALGLYPQAMVSLDKVHTMLPRRQQPFLIRVRLLNQLGKDKEAAKYKKIADSLDNFATIDNQYALTLKRRHSDIEGRIQDDSECIKLRPDVLETYLLRARSYREIGKPG